MMEATVSNSQATLRTEERDIEVCGEELPRESPS